MRCAGFAIHPVAGIAAGSAGGRASLTVTIEVAAGQLPLAVAQDVMFRLGRAYPAGWDEHGRALHCASRVEWLGAEGEVLAASDYERRERYLAAVCRNRSPEIAAHWEFLLAPMAVL